MALYIGYDKYKVISDNIIYAMKLFSETPITNNIRLLSSDGYTLKDSNGLYLTTVKESE